MKQSLFLVLCTLAVAFGANYNGLRVKYGPRAESADKNYYFNIPRSRLEAEQAGWTMFIQPYDSKVQGLYMYCFDNFLICSLYNVQGFIAGLQISVPYEDFVPAPNTLESRMKVWQAPAAFGESSKIYWTQSIVFASEATFKSSGGPTPANGQTLQDGGVWVHGLDDNLLKFPSTEAELQKSNFTKENCVRGQGTYYYYKMNTETACENYLPYYGLVNNGDLVGNGVYLFGKFNKQQPSGRQWFEDLRPYRETTLYVTPIAPQCFYDWSDDYGVLGVHIYYIDEPWNIQCGDSDSVAVSPPLLEKIMKVQKELNINQH